MHLVFERGKRSGSNFELRHDLLHKKFCGFSFLHDANVSAGFIVNGTRFFLAEVAPMLSASSLVLVHECLFGAFTDAFTMPKLRCEIHPLLASICTDRASKQAICVWGGRIQQRNQVVF